MKRAGLTRPVRSVATLLFTALCVAYVVWKIDIGETLHLLASIDLSYFALAAVITLLAIPPMAWRWQWLLSARGVHAPLQWLIRTYYVSYAVAQVLPTALGGDAARIYSTGRRYRDSGSVAAGSVLLERALGGAATLLLAAVGFVLAVGHYDVGPYLWIEAVFVVATGLGAVIIFSRRARSLLARFVPALRSVRLERPIRAAYEGLHGYRDHAGVVAWAFALTLFVQVFRVLAIWLVGKACGVDLSPRPYYVLGPLLFLVMLVPFTVNGIALREAFFVSFLGQLHVDPNAAFATGFLFFLLSIVTGIPGAIILTVESVRGRARTSRTQFERDDKWSKEGQSPSSSRPITRNDSSPTP
jgi:glycosyltransferase 2 family protein